MHSSRRELLGLLGAVSVHAASIKAGLILVNGNIHTVEPASPHARGTKQPIGMEALRVATIKRRARLVVLGCDPKREDPGSPVSIPGVRTTVGGRRVWEA
jgi:hypothetical protein